MASGEISCTDASLINVYDSGKADDSSIRYRTRDRLAVQPTTADKSTMCGEKKRRRMR